MKTFKYICSVSTWQESVKKQFDERQDQVKEMMSQMKARFGETLKDKEEIFNRRVQKAEKNKDRGWFSLFFWSVSMVYREDLILNLCDFIECHLWLFSKW